MNNNIDNNIRIYSINSSCIFKRNKDAFGDLSNMSTSYPLFINGIKILTNEALYQACRYPNNPEIQKELISQKSPMSVKMISRKHIKLSRNDWNSVRVDIMYWCLKVKLAQNFISFGRILDSTNSKDIVENSSSDQFWGAKKMDENTYSGKNALGRLLMKLREEYHSEKKYDLLCVSPPQIPNFKIYDELIKLIDERKNFLNQLIKIWHYDFDKILNYDLLTIDMQNENSLQLVKEPMINEYKKINESKKKIKKPKSKKKKIELPNLFE